MDVILRLKDSEKEDSYVVRNVDDVSSFTYIDSDGALCTVETDEGYLCIFRRASDHSTRLLLGTENSLELHTAEGSFSFWPKVIEFRKNNDIISIVYTVEGDLKSIEIEYIGD